MDWTARVRAEFATTPLEPDVVEELADHLRAIYDSARASGLTDQDADRRISEALARWRADATSLRRVTRPPAVTPPPIASSSIAAGLGQDVRYAARLLRRQGRHALLVIVTMALGIAAATVLFSVTYAVLGRPLPWPDADRLVVLKETRGGRAPRFGAFSNAALVAWRDEAHTVDHLAAWSQRSVTLDGATEPERIRIVAASAQLLAALGVRPLRGSLFETTQEGDAVILLAEGLWRRRFGGSANVVGTTVGIDGRPHTVVGVLPDARAFPDRQTQAWVPMRVPPASPNALAMFNLIGRLRPDMTPVQAAAEGTARGRSAVDTGMTTMAIFGGTGPIEVTATALQDTMTAEVRRPLLMLLAAVGLLLVTATVNVASLQLARATTRRREFAIRAAIGAGGARLTRQLLIENLLLGAAGGTAGIGLAWAMHRGLPALLPPDFPRVGDVALDSMVLLFGLGISVVTGIACGVLPAARMRRLNLVDSLAEDGRAPAGAGLRLSITRLRLLIVAAQIALACLLLIGASLFGRSFWALLHVDRGYDPSSVVTASLPLPGPRFTPERRYALIAATLERLAAIPGVDTAAFTSELPLTPGGSTAAFTMQSPILRGSPTVQASPRIVSPEYFATMRMRLIAGRTFTEGDTETSEPVVMVNRSFARQYLGESPLEGRLPMGVGYLNPSRDARVVGVIDDVRYVSSTDAAQPEVYYSYRQLGSRVTTPGVTMLVRAAQTPERIIPLVRAAIRTVDPGLVADRVATLEQRQGMVLARPRLYAVLLAVFAGCALTVTGVGLFGVLSYTVAQRARELAVRAALGARRIDLVRLVFTQGLVVTAVGLSVGILASLAITPLLRTLLYGVTSHDGVTFVAVPLVLVGVTVAACLAPARRASRIDLSGMLRP